MFSPRDYVEYARENASLYVLEALTPLKLKKEEEISCKGCGTKMKDTLLEYLPLHLSPPPAACHHLLPPPFFSILVLIHFLSLFRLLLLLILILLLLLLPISLSLS